MYSLRRRLFLLVLLATAAVGCSSSSGPSDDDDDDDISRGTVQGSFGHSGNLGTIVFAATTVLPSRNSQGVGIIAVDGSGRRFQFFLEASANGNYSVTAQGTQMSVEVGTQLWRNAAGSTGTITISSINATTMSGTVAVVLQAVDVTGATGTMTVALTFSGTFGET
jgi:hypothetical protein